MDREIRALSNGIIEWLNLSPVPMEVKRLVLVEILTKVSAEANKQVIEQEQKEVHENELHTDTVEG